MSEDVTNRSHAMSRDAALLYPNLDQRTPHDCDFRGVLKLETGATFWVAAWARIVHGKPVIEIKLTPKTSAGHG